MATTKTLMRRSYQRLAALCLSLLLFLPLAAPAFAAQPKVEKSCCRSGKKCCCHNDPSHSSHPAFRSAAGCQQSCPAQALGNNSRIEAIAPATTRSAEPLREASLTTSPAVAVAIHSSLLIAFQRPPPPVTL